MASKYTLTTQPTAKAVKFAFYGPEGVGKTTLASKLPGAVTIDTEGSTAHMTLCRYPRPKDWAELMDMVDDAGRQKIGTLIIDTLDWADILCTQSLCKEKKWDSIEAAGYGKGYVMLGEKFAELLAKLSELADRGINVGFCAHAQLRKIEKPEETGAYDHWELKCSKKVAPLVKEWADLILFCNYDTIVIHGNNPMEANRITGTTRLPLMRRIDLACRTRCPWTMSPSRRSSSGHRPSPRSRPNPRSLNPKTSCQTCPSPARRPALPWIPFWEMMAEQISRSRKRSRKPNGPRKIKRS